MKNLVFLLIVLGWACTGSDKPLNDDEKEKIFNETATLVSKIYKACESCNPQMLTDTYLNSPDFSSLINGDYANYEQIVKKYPELMSGFKAQKAIILNEKYIILDDSTVLYTSNAKWECTLKNDSIVKYDPCGLQALLKKTNNDWKVLSWVESY